MVYLVCLGHLVCFVDQSHRFFQLDKPNKPLQPNKPAPGGAPPFHLQIYIGRTTDNVDHA